MLRFDGGIKISYITRKTVLYLLVLFMGIFLFCGAASAATINVNPNTGLKNAIFTAHPGDTLKLSAGTYNEHDIVVNKNLTIIGPKIMGNNPPTAEINAQKRGKVFNISSGVNVTLQYLLIQNGTATKGGGIYNTENLNINNCIIQDNTATDGGGIYNIIGANLNINNCIIQDNTATNTGGGICNAWGNVTLTDTSVLNNNAVNAGGIYNVGTDTGIDPYGYLTLTGCNVYENTATTGGGIYNNFTLTMANSNVFKNTASTGGGIYNNGDDEYTTLSVSGCNVFNNNARAGGGIYINKYSHSTVFLTDTNVYNNTARDFSGGGIYNAGTLNLTDTNVYNNTATGSIGSGGGIYNAGTLNLTDTNVYNNTSRCAGTGIYNRGTATLIRGNIENNTIISQPGESTSGGGIFNDKIGILTLIDTNVYNNKASADGGGIYNDEYGIVTLTGCNVFNNTGDFGAGISNMGTVALTGCNVFNNTAITGGGIGNNGNGFLSLNDSNVYNNTATYAGGGISNSLGGLSNSVNNVTITFCRINGNIATQGTDIYCFSGSVNAIFNWWGSNSDPSSNVYGTVTVTPWLVLNLTANPTNILIGGTSNITADLLHDSNGGYHTPTSGRVPDGIPVTFSSTKGTINSPLSTSNGTAKATLNDSSISGIADVFATVDNQTVHTSVTINPDSTPPTITSTNPAQYAVNLPSNQVFTVTYSEAIKAGNLNLVVLKTSTGTLIPTTKTITGNVLTITPNSALGEAKYLLMLYAGCVTDLAGNPAAATTRTYSVGAQPYVTSTNPANYAVNVPRNTAITATFNEPIVAKYLTLIYLKTAIGGILVPTTKSVSGNVLTITPTSPLVAGTRYMLLIYTFAVTDLYGNSNVNKAISFTTGAT